MRNFEMMSRDESIDNKNEGVMGVLFNENPEKHIVMSAVEKLKDKNDVMIFFNEYVELLKKVIKNPKERAEFFERYLSWLDEEVRLDPVKAAQSNIRNIISVYDHDKDMVDRWSGCLRN